MSYERRTFERLIEYLADLGGARELGVGRIEVSLTTATGARRTVQILMRPADFSDWASTINGSFWLTANEVRTQLLELPEGVPYLVFDSYELVASQTETLPPDPDEVALKEHLRQNPDARVGWFATRADGTGDYFASHPDEEDGE